MKHRKSRRLFVQIATVCMIFLTLVDVSYGALTVESYCQLNIGIEQQGAGYLGEVLALMRKYCEDPNFLQAYYNDPNCFLQQKGALGAAFDSNESALYTSFNTTAGEYNTFKDQNAQAIEEYLNDPNSDPNISMTLYDLSRTIANLSKKVETPSYCLLTVAVSKQEIGNLNELIALAQQYSGDPNTFLQQEQLKRSEFESDAAALFASFGTTAEGYLFFAGKNKQRVDGYLDNCPDLKQTINNFGSQLNTLMASYESLKASICGQ